MKTLSTKWAVLLMALAIMACSKKEDYTDVKKELLILSKNWNIAGESLRSVMSKMKTDIEKYGKAQQNLEKLSQSKNITLKKETVTVLTNAKKELDSLRVEMKDLNAYAKDWGIQSKALNKLIVDMKDESITVAVATAEIERLRAFKSQADPKLTNIQSKLNAYAPRNEKLNAYISKHKKKMP